MEYIDEEQDYQNYEEPYYEDDEEPDFDEDQYYEEPTENIDDDQFIDENEKQYNEIKAFERTGDAALNLNDPSDLFVYLVEKILQTLYPGQNVKSSYILSTENLSYFDMSISNPYAYVFANFSIENGTVNTKTLNEAYNLLKKNNWYDMYNIQIDIEKIVKKEDIFRYARHILKKKYKSI